MPAIWQGIKVAVVSNIAFDVRPAFESIGAVDDVDEFVLSFEVGAVKPNAEIFETTLKRLGVAGEIAEAVVWMCSERASFMTGASHVIDGGYYAA